MLLLYFYTHALIRPALPLLSSTPDHVYTKQLPGLGKRARLLQLFIFIGVMKNYTKAYAALAEHLREHMLEHLLDTFFLTACYGLSWHFVVFQSDM